MSLAEQYANDAQTTLAGSILAGDGTLSVASATGWPSAGQFRAIIGSEIVLVTGVSGTTFTVSRGQEGTTAASHGAGTTITQIITRAGLIGVCGSHILSDTYANLPAAGVVGQLFFPTDGSHLLRDNGTAFQGFGPLFPMTPPDNTQFSWVNQGTASLTASGGTIFLNAAATGVRSVRARIKSAPATPYTITAFIKCVLGPDDGNEYGLGWRESSSGKLSTFALAYANGGLNWQWIDWASPISLSGTNTIGPNGNTTLSPHAGIFFRISDDGTNRKASYSIDGQNFIQVGTIGRTSFITPDQVLFMADPNSASRDIYMTVYSWDEA